MIDDFRVVSHKHFKGFPFTFDQNISSHDPRQQIPTAGFRRLFIKTRRHHGREVTAVAYRNNGNVTLGMSTVYSDHEWDLVLEDPSDREKVKDPQWSVDSLLNTALVNSAESNANRQGLHVLLSNLPVDFITTDQNSPGWFLLRSFAITSSAADSILDELCEEAKCRRLADPLLSHSRRIIRYYSTIDGTDLDSNQGDSDGSDDGSGEVENLEPDIEEPEDEEYTFSINDVADSIAEVTDEED